VTDSQYVARELEERFRVPASRLHPIPLGIGAHLRRPAADAVAAARAALKLERPYLLFVGTLEPRKNLPFLVEVFERLEGFDGELVLAGRRGWKDGPILERIRASRLAARIRRLEAVDDALLPALYAGAELFVLPSLYEGFGFTPLEAMACGTPVLAAAAGSLPEVLGDGARLLADYDAHRWAEEIRGLLRDGAQRAALRERGVRQAAKFTWAETARQTWALYRRLGAKEP
jgi:glycosyltransferase involved in cell wall biosynthesis